MSIHTTIIPAPTEDATRCPMCLNPFAAMRANQSYCTRKCQKRFSRNATRGPQTLDDSPDARRRNEARSGRLRGLSDALFETPPVYRAEFMERLIAEARSRAELKRLVSGRGFILRWTRYQGTGRLHISFVLAHYCGEVYGQPSYQVLDKNFATQPRAYPAAYFGPDAVSVYEDGALNRRPQTAALSSASSPAPRVPTSSNRYDWRKLGRAMQDHGWQRHFDAEDTEERVEIPNSCRFDS